MNFRYEPKALFKAPSPMEKLLEDGQTEKRNSCFDRNCIAEIFITVRIDRSNKVSLDSTK